MPRLFAIAAALLAAPAFAADEPPVGMWARDADGVALLFVFDDKTVTITVTAGDNGATVTATPTVKDGRVALEVTKVVETGNFLAKPKVGAKFSFKWVEKDFTADLSDFRGEGADKARNVVEGEYQKQAK